MAVEIRLIEPTKRNLLKFVHYPIDVLYKGNPYYVPSLVTDEVGTLTPSENPAFEFCQSVYYMAYRDGKPVGRIAGIINRVVNEREGKQECRFGFVDFIDDDEVVDGLIGAVTRWAKERGMEYLTGPLGFTDMDPEGCLIEGFDELSTQATIYNYPYYGRQLERVGFEKDTDWVEYKVFVPDTIPEKMVRISKIVQEKYGLRNLHLKSRKQLVRDYADAVFHLINKAYDSLFGYSPLTEAQIQHYIKLYLPALPLDHISLIVDASDRLVGVGISIPSLSHALQASRGRYLPLGWLHLLRAITGHSPIVDLMLIAVEPELQSKGVNSMLFTDLLPVFQRRHYKWAETNVELEDNANVQKQWQYFDYVQHKRRRAYTKAL
jgi:hypothetical protein